MYTPRVTVIIPTYNWSTVLPYSIGSVLRQTFEDFELLVVGDGCTDDSEDVVAQIGDPRIRWINLPANTGHASGPNNRALAEARGELIAYLGHDDLWLPHHLERMVGAIDATHADLAYSLVASVERDATTATPLWPMPAGGSWSPPAGMMHRRAMTERIGGWADYRTLRIGPDSELWRRAQKAGCRFTFVPRLTALKLPAGHRRSVYRDKPCHEQARWFARICEEPDFEAAHLTEMMLQGESARAMPGRLLFSIAVQELARRARMRVWHATMALSSKGSVLDAVKRYKGL